MGVQTRERCSISRCCLRGVGAPPAAPLCHGKEAGGWRTGTRMNWSDWCRANFFIRFLITTLPPALRLRAVTLSPAIVPTLTRRPSGARRSPGLQSR